MGVGPVADDTIKDVVIGVSAVLNLGGGVLVALLLGRRKAAADDKLATAAVTTAEAAEANAEARLTEVVTAGLRAISDELRSELVRAREALRTAETELAGARKELGEARGEVASLRGELRQNRQVMASMVKLLRDQGLEIPSILMQLGVGDDFEVGANTQ